VSTADRRDATDPDDLREYLLDLEDERLWKEKATMTNRIEIPNLDDQEERDAFLVKTRGARSERLRTARLYAEWANSAAISRLAGRITEAVKADAEAQRAYLRLDAADRW